MRKIKEGYNKLPLTLKASLCFLVCAIMEKVIAFIVLPVFSRLLTTDQYGLVTLYNSWLQIVCIFTTLNLQYGSLGTAQIKFKEEKYSYSATIQILVSLICVIALFIVMFCSDFFQNLFNMPIYLILMMIVESWASFIIGLWNGNKRFEFNYKSFIFITLFVSIASSGLGIVMVLHTKYKAEARIFTMIGVELIIAIILFIKILKRGKYVLKKVYLKFALKNNIPIIPYYFSKVVFNASDKIIIAKLIGNDKAGIYGLVYMLAFAMDFFRVAINNAYGPWCYNQIKNRDNEKVQLVNRYIIFGVLYILFIFILIGPELVWIIGGINYCEARWIVPFVIISLLFLLMSDFSCYIEFYFEKKFGLVFFTVLSALINIVLNYLCIPYFGYMVASVTTLISYIILWGGLSLSAINTCKENEISPEKYLDVGFQVKIAIIGIAFSVISITLYNLKYVRYAIMMIFIIVGLKYFIRIVNNTLYYVLEEKNV